ncbi:MAG: hypothetical protein ACTHN5_15660 [Phycisphaerae bacterium]
MGDLQNPRWMYLKAALFVAIGAIAGGMLWLETPTWKTAALLVLAIWAFSRAYYFAFYVIEKYVDPGYRFSGLWSFARYLLAAKKLEQKRTSDRVARSDVADSK